jgi:hypothetical protein
LLIYFYPVRKSHYNFWFDFWEQGYCCGGRARCYCWGYWWKISAMQGATGAIVHHEWLRHWLRILQYGLVQKCGTPKNCHRRDDDQASNFGDFGGIRGYPTFSDTNINNFRTRLTQHKSWQARLVRRWDKQHQRLRRLCPERHSLDTRALWMRIWHVHIVSLNAGVDFWKISKANHFLQFYAIGNTNGRVAAHCFSIH